MVALCVMVIPLVLTTLIATQESSIVGLDQQRCAQHHYYYYYYCFTVYHFCSSYDDV